MNTVGFPISRKENENRRTLLPEDIKNIDTPKYIFLEKGYGLNLGYTDQEYINLGVNIVSRDEVLTKDIICDPKIGDADYIDKLKCQTIFGWVHAVQNRGITDILIKNELTAFAWEEMFDRGRHTFYRNNEIAGEAAIIHAFLLHGLFPYETKVAILGRGNIARGAMKILNYMGANISVYDRKTEQLFREELFNFDVIVNAITWDTTRKDHIIYQNDLKYLKKDTLIIDISCDKNGAIETSVPTTIENPTYVQNGITHYVVDHTPSLFYKTISKSLSSIVSYYINFLINNKVNDVLNNALIVKKGVIIDSKINDFQNRAFQVK
ncbi:N(5)-(carboxyethyl)ornithine synthase [uncultured Sunxiuqinia sp.]|uniref:N(5)-(carboxyethyl)ornithine synthase n=1 Tax=uncultured Sunxiuqinia sp. TaxID=1573825 RepID=UPI002613C857|nr:N(5)-(carboxyethyl)ornithine synthase [uncultured Sunxiuqinia sp.]